MKLQVFCSICGFLGSFFVTPEQHLEGARTRAKTLQEGHRCPDDPMRVSPGSSQFWNFHESHPG